MTSMRILVFAACAALPAQAETPLSAEEFEARTTGKTLYYATGGFDYGIEEYLSNRRVRWSYIGDECHEGEWYPLGDLICFEYDGIGDPQCWTFYDTGRGLLARFENGVETTELVETRQSSEPLLCLGPKVGS